MAGDVAVKLADDPYADAPEWVRRFVAARDAGELEWEPGLDDRRLAHVQILELQGAVGRMEERAVKLPTWEEHKLLLAFKGEAIRWWHRARDIQDRVRREREELLREYRRDKSLND